MLPTYLSTKQNTTTGSGCENFLFLLLLAFIVRASLFSSYFFFSTKCESLWWCCVCVWANLAHVQTTYICSVSERNSGEIERAVECWFLFYFTLVLSWFLLHARHDDDVTRKIERELCTGKIEMLLPYSVCAVLLTEIVKVLVFASMPWLLRTVSLCMFAMLKVLDAFVLGVFKFLSLTKCFFDTLSSTLKSKMF